MTRVAMWSGPRNISTAMMRAWENRPDTVVVDEPLYAAYLAATGIDHPGRDEVIASQPTDPALVVQALLGDDFRYEGLDRSQVHRWFTHPEGRDVYPAEDHDHQSRVQVADLRVSVTRRGAKDPRAHAIVDSLLERSPEFRLLWQKHDVAERRGEEKRIVHPELGVIAVDCQILTPNDDSQRLLVFTAVPGIRRPTVPGRLPSTTRPSGSVIGNRAFTATTGESSVVPYPSRGVTPVFSTISRASSGLSFSAPRRR